MLFLDCFISSVILVLEKQHKTLAQLVFVFNNQL